MPTVRYQIRNEYGLADPELYQAADKDDPEAVLEGVAMAGLVGVLRQLGDLAEFAAEIFHDLHEEVTTTAARGHGLMLRVQQLESEFPSIEKAFLVRTSHSHFAYNDGIDWHAHLRMDQNLVTQGDMPRFILDSYEECRGPPRLFMLDKFDVAGAGACLKRYSDPSFFKVEFSSSGMMEEEIQWEQKSRKVRKKASHWRNGETNESFLAPLINSNLQPDSSDQVSAKVPTRRVKLKSMNLLDSDITDRRSYMERLLEVHPSEQKVLPKTYIRHSPIIVKSLDSSGLTTEVHEAVIDTIDDSTIVRDTYPTQSPTRKEVTYIPANELENHKVKSAEVLGSIPKKKIVTEPEIKTVGYMSDKAENRSPPRLEMDEKKSFTDGEFTPDGGFDGDKSDGYRPENSPTVALEVDENRSLAYAEFTPEDEYDECKSDDICYDLDNYMDALNTIESDVETDSESRVKSDSGFLTMGAHRIGSGNCEQELKLPAQRSEPDSVGQSIASREWITMLEHPPPNSVVSGNLADTQEPPEHVNGLYVPANQDNFLKESPDKSLDECQANTEVRERASSVHLFHNGTCNARKSDYTSITSEVGEPPSGSYVIHVCSLGSVEAQSVTPSPDNTSGYAEDTHVSQQLDHKAEELSDFTDDFCNFYGDSMPLSEMGDLSLYKNDIPEVIHSAEGVEEHNSEVITGRFDISDHLSETENASAFEKVSEHHIGEATFTLTTDSGEQEEPVREAEGCLDGSVSPNIHESPEIGPTVVHPVVTAPEISNDDVKSSCEAPRDFDSILPHTDSLEFNEPIIESRILSDDLLPLSDILGTINSAEDVEPVFSEDMEHIQGKTISDEVPVFFEDMEDIQGKTISDEVRIGHIEDPPVFTVQPGTPQDPMEADIKSYSHENKFVSVSALSLSNGQCTMQPGVRNIAAGGEDTTAEGMIARETSLVNVVLLELEHFSGAKEPQESQEVNSPKLLTMFSGKETFLDNMLLQSNSSTEDAGKSNVLMPNIKPVGLGNFSDTEKPQESCDADSADHLRLYSANSMLSADMQLQNEESGFMVNSDAEEPKQSHHAASMEYFPLGSGNEIFPDGMQLPNTKCGLMMTSYEDSKESSSADSAEHFFLDSTNEMFPDKTELQNKKLGCMTDGFEPVSNTLGLPSESIASDLKRESFQLEKPTEFDHSLDEYVIVEGNANNQGCTSVYSVDSSGYDVPLQENYLAHDAVLDRRDIEVNVSSDLKNSTIRTQNESEPIFSTGVSSSESLILPSFDPSDSKKLDSACCTILPDSIIDKETMTYSSENEDYGSKEGISLSSHFLVEPEISTGDDSKENVVSLHLEGEQHEASLTQSQRTCTCDTNPTQNISKDIEDQPSKSEPSVVLLSGGETNELDVSLSDIGTELLPIASSSQSVSETNLQEAAITISTQDISETSLQETAIASSSQSISGTSLQETSEPCPDKPIFIASSILDISETNLQETAITNSSQDFPEADSQETTIARSGQAISEAILLETSEPLSGPPTSCFQSQNVDETPPLPPLPPIEWRLGKLRLGSPSLAGNTNQPQLITNLFMELMGDDKYPQGPVITAAMVQPGNTFTSLPVAENEKFRHGSLISVDEVTRSSGLFELPPVTNEESKHRSLRLDGEIINSSSPFQVVADIEDEKLPSGRGASVPTVEDGTTQYPQLLQGEGQDGQQRRPQLGHLLPSLELERSQHEALSMAPNPMLPMNPFFIGSSTEDWKHHYAYGAHGGEYVQHLNLSAPVVDRGPNMPPYGFLYPIGENPSTLYDFMIPTAEGEKLNWRYCSIRDRPRDPLIEAVAAHDRSKLRKVSELDRPSVRPKADERDSLLEQIKNKSFNLKPANAKKLNIKGVPPTNLKISAILEKANAIRQACAGSDEDEEDDGDSWSDS